MATTTLDRAVEPGEIVDALKQYGLTQQDIATATDVSAKSVSAWRAGLGIRSKAYDRLTEVRDIVRELQDSLTPRGVGQWFRARNRLLQQQRPIDVLNAGDVEAVKAAAQAFVEGVYV